MIILWYGAQIMIMINSWLNRTCEQKDSFIPDSCLQPHRCKPTCRCGYCHEIVCDAPACNLSDVKTEQWRQLIFASRKYELSSPFSFDNNTQATHANIIHNIAEISTPANWFAPVTIARRRFRSNLLKVSFHLNILPWFAQLL